MAYTAEQLELRAYLEAKAAEAKAWVAEDPENRFAGYATTDLDHWAEYGIYSVAQYERQSTIDTIVDLYKSAHGVKPRWMNFNEMSLEELDELLERVAAENDEALKAEREEENRAAVSFKAEVANNLMLGAESVVTAVEWIRDAYQDEFDSMYGDSNLEYQLGLPYGFVKKYLAGEA